MASIKESDIERRSDEHFLLCSPCKRKEKNKEADKYCTDCNDYYCSDCVKFHEDIPALSGHKILDKGQVKEGESKGLPIAPTERCERHRFKSVDMYCQNHDDVGCYTCMAVDHRSCKDIFDIPEFIQNNKASTDLKEIKQQLSTAKADLKETLDICKRDRDRLLKCKEEALHSVKVFRKEIDARLEVLEQNTVALIETKYTILLEKFSHEIKVLENSQTEVVCAEDRLTSYDSNTSQAFVDSKIGKRIVNNSKKCKEDINSDELEVNIDFIKDEQLLDFLAETDTLGRIRQSNELYKVKKKKTYNIRHSSDKKTCTISSVCMLEDGTTILADTGNDKLKRIDSTYTVMGVCDLPVSPYQVCAVNKQNVAVISAWHNIYFVSVESEMKKTTEIKTDHTCWGIASTKDNMYVTDLRTSVFIYSMTGTVVKQYTRDQSGQALFNSINSITVSNDGRRIYVADNMYGVVVLRGDGTLQGKYDCPGLLHVKRVCLAENGSFFASGTKSSCILQFTPDGKKLGVVLPSCSGNKACRAICFDQRKSKLLVGRENKDEIDIYDLI